MALDPSRPRSGTPRRVTPEIDGELAHFVRRLRALGATEDEIDATVEHWDNLDAGFTALDRAQMARWSDPRLRAELAALRREYAEHTT